MPVAAQPSSLRSHALLLANLALAPVTLFGLVLLALLWTSLYWPLFGVPFRVTNSGARAVTISVVVDDGDGPYRSFMRNGRSGELTTALDVTPGATLDLAFDSDHTPLGLLCETDGPAGAWLLRDPRSIDDPSTQSAGFRAASRDGIDVGDRSAAETWTRSASTPVPQDGSLRRALVAPVSVALAIHVLSGIWWMTRRRRRRSDALT
jgi:hypothetical protein